MAGIEPSHRKGRSLGKQESTLPAGGRLASCPHHDYAFGNCYECANVRPLFVSLAILLMTGCSAALPSSPAVTLGYRVLPAGARGLRVEVHLHPARALGAAVLWFEAPGWRVTPSKYRFANLASPPAPPPARNPRGPYPLPPGLIRTFLLEPGDNPALRARLVIKTGHGVVVRPVLLNPQITQGSAGKPH